MKISTLKIFGFALVVLLFASTSLQACNLSDLTPISITGGPLGPFVIRYRLCVGMGITGGIKGGDQITSSMYFGFYDSQPGFTVLAFTPANLAGPAVGVPPVPCIMPGTNFGPDPYFGLQGEVIYNDPGYYGNAPCAQHSYGCVSSTLFCGGVRSYCQVLTVTVNQIPDSMRVFGVEGGGNPVGGCYPNPDMMINFNSFLPIVWGEIEGQRSTAGITVKWSTLLEVNSDYFIVERSVDGGSFAAIGEVSAAGNSSTQLDYQFVDLEPRQGSNQYRIVHVDRSGLFNDSETIEVEYFQPEGISWGGVGPNPTSGPVAIAFYNPANEVVELQVGDATGRLVVSEKINAIHGGNVVNLDLANVNAGGYYLSLQGLGDRITRKLTKL